MGARCYGAKNWPAAEWTNGISALVQKTLLTIGLFKTNINADIFLTWVTQDLLPKLPPACVIVMENATFHKRRDIQNAIANAGRTLKCLPAYSPDLNAIEPKWDQSKSVRKKESGSIERIFAADAL